MKEKVFFNKIGFSMSDNTHLRDICLGITFTKEVAFGYKVKYNEYAVNIFFFKRVLSVFVYNKKTIEVIK